MSPRRQGRTRPSNTASSVQVAATTTLEEPITVTATEAQNEFGRVFDRAARDQVVVITKHNAPRVVLLSIERYNALVGAGAAALDTLTSEFDALLERMQSPTARAGMQQAFNASPKQLAAGAVAKAKSKAHAP
jgi:antitoxin Phd